MEYPLGGDFEMRSFSTAILVSVLTASAASAASIKIYWSGTLSSVNGQFGSLDQGLSRFDRIDGTITYETFSDTDSDPDRLRSSSVDATVTMSLGADTFAWRGMEASNVLQPTFGSIFSVDNTRDSAPTGSLLGIDILDNDSSDFLATDPDAPGGVATAITRNGSEMTRAAAGFDLQIDDRDEGLFGPTFDFANIDLDDFSRKFFTFFLQEDFSSEGGSGSGSNFIQGTVSLDYWSSVTPRPENPQPNSVPLPATAWMLLLGAFGLGLSGIRRKPRD
jgi:hypothetical protein